MQVVLVNPEIPQNTGSIARTCAAVKTSLHLVGPLGFELTEKRVRRAGLDYWPLVQLREHAGWEDYLQAERPPRLWFFSARASRLYHTARFAPDDALVFGRETDGLGAEFIGRQPPEQILAIPMLCSGVRSLNLSNTVAIALYEALRQLGTI
jgi:tRNA (cytidine/uridine-2'-O-)-methyltransferase